MSGVGGWSLRRRLATATTVLGALLIGLIAGAIVLLFGVRSQQHAVIDRYFTAVSTANLRFTQQLDAETSIRGYALTGDSVTLQPLHEIRSASYAAQVPRLRGLLHSDATTITSFDTWVDASNTWYQQWALPSLTEIKAHGGNALTNAQVLAGKALFDRSRTAYFTFVQQLVSKRNAASHALTVRTDLLFAAALLVAVSVGFAGAASWWGLRRWVLRPLTALGAETKLVQSGAMDHEVVVAGPAEIVGLASDVEDMRREIVDKLAAVERARLEIEASRRMLETQAQELARSNRDLEQFAYVASHDLQEPLRKVASFCQMLERRYSGQLDERADQYIAFAVDGAKRMQQLINDLLAFSRVGRVTDNFVDVDLQDCFAAALDNLSVAIEASHAQVTASDLPHVNGDPGLLTQLFQNLIGNAIKFRGEATPVIRISARQVDDAWDFSCADNGPGVEPQYAERIFVIFQRLHGKDEYPGTGIGLALCKRIVEHHGGLIWLDAASQSGATFRWTLPSARPALVDTPSSLHLEST